MSRRLLLAVALLLVTLPLGASGAQAQSARHLRVVVPLIAGDAGLKRFATAVSTPGSPAYGHYLSVYQLARRFGATRRRQRRAVTFLRAAGASAISVSPTGMFVQAQLSVPAAEAAFAVRLRRVRSRAGTYYAPASGARAAASGARAAAARGVPPGLAGVALGVVGLDSRPLPLAGSLARLAPRARVGRLPRLGRPSRARRARAAADSGSSVSGYAPASGTPAGCAAARAGGGFTPNEYLTAYGYDALRSQNLTGSGQRVALIEVDGFKRADLRGFAHCFGLRLPRITTTTVGGSRRLPPGGEATLDLEVLDAAAPGLDEMDVYESGGDAAQVVDAFAAPLVAPGAKPQILTASLGLCEADMYGSFGRSGVLSVERDLELAAASGITIVAAAGDAGSSACLDDQGDPVPELAVNYPASSPYVTAVGGTNILLDSANAIADQVVWNDGQTQALAGGGGISRLFDRPAYQAGATSAPGRAVPDVSMLADVAPGYAILCTARGDSGCAGWGAVGGTSAAAPLLAGGLALVDQDLARHGRESLGTLNPLLYGPGARSAASVFRDVTQSDNDLGPYLSEGDGQPLGCCAATPGFDAASGWGSVRLTALAALALRSLPHYPQLALRVPRGQRPARRGGVLALVACTGACAFDVEGFATVRGGRPFDASSGTRHLRRAGRREVLLRFTRRQRHELAAALRRRRRVRLELFAFGIDSHGRIARVTPGVELEVRS